LIFFITLLIVNLLKENESFYQKEIVLLTQFYKPKWDFRFQEIKECLVNNLKNKYFKNYFIL